jgi:pimeloyl-ACP methyl ester carboxylesterase
MAPARCGFEPSSGLFYETLGYRRADAPPLVFIHGAGATGACWRCTPDGRAGWGDLLARRGHECWLADWPGTGRSGGRTAEEITYDDLVDGFQALLREIVGRPSIVICHSMGGAIAWQLVARMPELVVGVISIAGAYPGNLTSRSRVISSNDGVMEIEFADTGVRFVVDERRPYLYEDAYVREQAIATSTRFREQDVPRLRSTFVGIPPRVLLQRLGVVSGMPLVAEPAGFRGMRIRLLAGPEDPAHTREIDTRTVEQLRAWGADATLTWLADLGIDGNGHFLFYEENSDEVLAVVERLIGEVAA